MCVCVCVCVSLYTLTVMTFKLLYDVMNWMKNWNLESGGRN